MAQPKRRAWAWLFCGLLFATPLLAESQVVEIGVSRDMVHFTPLVEHEGIVLTVRGESGETIRREFAAGASPYLKITEENGITLPDGSYTWELRAAPVIDPAVRQELRAARRTGDESIIDTLRERGDLPAQPYVQTGYLAVTGGAFVLDVPESAGNKDEVIADDVIVEGNLCVGIDCVDNEEFGTDTIRLKNNTVRLKFMDTSTSTGFATRDWQLTANGEGSGGASKFSIDDVDGALTPFTLEAGAPSHSLYVDNAGLLGLGTATPLTDVHVVDGSTPTLRLEQDNTASMTPQTWEVGGNETHFFVRDITGGLVLPLRIRAGAPNNSLIVDSDGNLIMGVEKTGGAAFHVYRTNRTASILVNEEAAGPAAEQTLLTLRNNGTVTFNMENTDSASTWQFRNTGTGGFTLTLAGSGGASLRVTPTGAFTVGNPGGLPNFQVAANGNATLTGTLTQGSDRDQKKDVVAVDGGEVLERLAAMPISRWTYAWDGPGVRHLGPMAQDFHAAFGLGDTDKGISTLDASGVALAAIQELDRENTEKDEKIAELEARLAALEALVTSLTGP